MDYLHRLSLLETIDRLEDRLEGLLDEKIITSDSYHRKKAYKQLIRAINSADIKLAAIRNQLKTVAIYIPSGLHVLPLAHHDYFADKPIDSVLSSTLASVHPSAIEAFIYEEPWNEVVGVFGDLSIYTGVIPGDVKRETGLAPTLFKAVRPDQFTRDALKEKSYWFDPRNRILHLSSSLDSDSFAVFEAYTRPAMIDVKAYDVGNRAQAEDTDLGDYTLDTLPVYEATLLDVALNMMFPTKTEFLSPAAIAFALEGLETGNGTIVYNMDD